MTGWGYDEIVYNLPFSAGLQIIHAEDFGKGRGKPWKTNVSRSKIDVLAKIEDAFQ